METEYLFYNSRTGLKDKEIVVAIKQAAEDYENGAIIDARDTLEEIINSIDAFDNDQQRKYG